MPFERLMVHAHQVSVGSALLLLLSLWLVGPRVDVIVALGFLHSLGAGACGPVVMALAIGVVPRLTASAAGLYGCVQMLIGALCAALVALHPDAAWAAATVLTAAGVLGQIAFHVARRTR